MKKPKMPNDLKIKIGSKDQQAWDNVAARLEGDITNGQIELEINKLVLDYAKKRREEEEAKFNSGE